MLLLVVGEPISILDAASASAAPGRRRDDDKLPIRLPAPGVFSKSPLSALGRHSQPLHRLLNHSDLLGRGALRKQLVYLLGAHLHARRQAKHRGKETVLVRVGVPPASSAKVAPYRLSSCALSFWR